MKFKRKKPVYKPKPIDNKEMDRGLEELFAKQKRDAPRGNQQSVQPQQQIPQQQPQQQQRMNIPNPFGGGDRDRTYNPPNPLGGGGGSVPNPLGGDVNVVNRGNQPMKFDAPNEWGVKPLNLSQQQPQRQQRPTRQTKLEDFGMQMQQQQPQPQQQQPEPEEEEPYWSAEEWETWAYQMAVSYPDIQQFLPEWFIQALQEEG